MTVREELASAENYGGSRKDEQIRYLVLHYTGNDGDTAARNAAYFRDNVVKASAHYFVDDAMIYRTVPELYVAWAVGGKRYSSTNQTGGGTMYGIVTNTNSISVELCDTCKDGRYQASEATLENAVELCRELMRKYDIPIENVYRHFDVTGKLCPSYFVDESTWSDFKARLACDNVPAPYAEEAVKWACANGILKGDGRGNLMLSSSCTRQQMAAFLYRFWDQFIRT